MDIISYVLGKKYTERFLTTGSTFKGVLQSSSDIPTSASIGNWWICNFSDTALGIDAGDRIIFNSTTTYAVDKYELKGDRGYGIANVEIRTVQGPVDMENHLIITLDDDLATELDAGIMPTIQALIHEEDVTTASDTWIIQHNLKAEWYNLSITCLDGDSNLIIGEIDVVNTTDNLLVIKFNEPITGKIIVKK